MRKISLKSLKIFGLTKIEEETDIKRENKTIKTQIYS